MEVKPVCSKRTRKKSRTSNGLCVTLFVVKDKCYIDYGRVPEQEKQMMLVK